MERSGGKRHRLARRPPARRAHARRPGPRRPRAPRRGGRTAGAPARSAGPGPDPARRDRGAAGGWHAAAVEREEARPPDRGLPVGAPAPAFTLPGLDGQTRSLAALLEPGRPVVLLFAALGCDPCAGLLPEIARWQREHAEAFTLALVSSGSVDDNRAKFGRLAPGAVLLQAGSEVADAYASQWTPGAVLIGPAGRIASPVAYGDGAIRALIAHAVAAPGVPQLGARPRIPAPRTARSAAGRSRCAPVARRAPALPRRRSSFPTSMGGRSTCRITEGAIRSSSSGCRAAPTASAWPTICVAGRPSPRAAPPASWWSPRDPSRRTGRSASSPRSSSTRASRLARPSAPAGHRRRSSWIAEGRIASTIGVGARDILALAGVVPIVGSPGAPPPLA